MLEVCNRGFRRNNNLYQFNIIKKFISYPKVIICIGQTLSRNTYRLEQFLNFFDHLILERKFDQGFPMKNAYKDLCRPLLT